MSDTSSRCYTYINHKAEWIKLWSGPQAWTLKNLLIMTLLIEFTNESRWIESLALNSIAHLWKIQKNRWISLLASVQMYSSMFCLNSICLIKSDIPFHIMLTIDQWSIMQSTSHAQVQISFEPMHALSEVKLSIPSRIYRSEIYLWISIQ